MRSIGISLHWKEVNSIFVTFCDHSTMKAPASGKFAFFFSCKLKRSWLIRSDCFFGIRIVSLSIKFRFHFCQIPFCNFNSLIRLFLITFLCRLCKASHTLVLLFQLKTSDTTETSSKFNMIEVFQKIQRQNTSM